MSKNAFLIWMLALAAISSACSAADTTNTNANANTNAVVTNQATLPPGFSTSPVAPSSNTTPGIPPPGNVNVSANPNGTPTPGIPDPTKKTPVPKGAAATPGIPDEKTLKQQIKSAPLSSQNQPPPVADTNSNVKARTVRKP